MTIQQNSFSTALLSWFEAFGRKDLPWQHPRNAYRVWISEIMLQQTQVKTVVPYFLAFIKRFPDLTSLANAHEDDVLSLWSGLGYYSRARNLHRAAILLIQRHHGEFPNTLDELTQLPGIGQSTAAAIMSLAFNQKEAILDGNVQRILMRCFLISGLSSQALVKKQLWSLAQECMPHDQCADYTQAIMDLGATCCTPKNPKCCACPLQHLCLANQHQCVQDYPQPKPKKVRPTKEEKFILLHTPQRLIYLEKRASEGLWGGLWCLPTVSTNTCAKQYVEDTLQLNVTDEKSLLTLKHTFSHFSLFIQAISIRATNPVPFINTPNGRWFSAQEVFELGLAKPVTTIIRAFLRGVS